LRQALEPAITSVEDGEQRWVILLDTCEHFSEAEASAVRTEVLSQLPATSLIVMAARARPGLAWFTDPGWGELLTPMPLHNRALPRHAPICPRPVCRSPDTTP
jgi:hypothetical protein